jgi:acyl-CoA dehydrogenase
VSGRKIFGSGGPGADMLVTSFAAPDEPEGPSVIHCAVPIAAEGVKRLDDWHTLGMRGTGSHSFVLEDVFVPTESVALKRPQAEWHAAWDVVFGVALPIVMAPYVGLAEAAYELALTHAKRKADSTTVQLAVGRMENALTTARLAWEDTLRLSGNCDFSPSIDNSNAQVVRKVIITNAVKETVERAIDAVGGAAFYRSLPIERMWRDVQAAHYHPLPEGRQLLFTGRQRLGRADFWDV